MTEHTEPDDGNLPGPDEIPDTAWLTRLQKLIHDAAAGGPTATEFVERLLVHAVRLVAQTSRSGRVSGVSYDYEGHVVKGSALGPAYTWSGLQKRLGVTYVRQRDQAAMEGRLEPPLAAVQRVDPDSSNAIEPQATLPWEAAADATDRTSDAPIELARPEASPPPVTSAPIVENAASPAATEHDDVAGNTSAEDQFGAEHDSLVAKSWEEWAAELEDEIASDDDANNHFADAEMGPNTTAANSRESAIPESKSTASAGASITVETEQWQALTSAIGELRDQVRSLEARVAELAPSSAGNERVGAGNDDGLSEQLTALTASVQQANRAAEQAREAKTHAKHDTLWMSVVGASIAGLLAALLVGLWLDQSAERRVDAMQRAVIDHMEKQAAEDPLRQYFDRIVKKLKQP